MSLNCSSKQWMAKRWTIPENIWLFWIHNEYIHGKLANAHLDSYTGGSMSPTVSAAGSLSSNKTQHTHTHIQTCWRIHDHMFWCKLAFYVLMEHVFIKFCFFYTWTNRYLFHSVSLSLSLSPCFIGSNESIGCITHFVWSLLQDKNRFYWKLWFFICFHFQSTIYIMGWYCISKIIN